MFIYNGEQLNRCIFNSQYIFLLIVPQNKFINKTMTCFKKKIGASLKNKKHLLLRYSETENKSGPQAQILMSVFIGIAKFVSALPHCVLGNYGAFIFAAQVC